MSKNQFDVVVVGGGPGGYVAAIRAAQLGMKIALVEREHLGGICLNWGCIPTKALLRSAEIFDFMKHADKFGLSVKGADFDLSKIVERSRGVSRQLSGGIAHLLKKNKVTVFDGEASLKTAGQLQVKDAKGTTDTVDAKHIILATGARARQLPGLEADGKLVWSYKEALVPEAMPRSLLIVGSGAIGMEFASFYNSLGAKVTVAEMLPQALPVEDKEISDFVTKAFAKNGIDVLLETTVKSLSKKVGSVVATLDNKGKTQE
ncbi:MAG: dihydrolipoyl dehydrogenase, partial [Gammaproteobacteria bacterium]